MSVQVKLDTRFLTTADVIKLGEEAKPSFEKAYRMALDSVENSGSLPYVPMVYIFPYLLVKEVQISAQAKMRFTYFAMLSVDPSDTRKLAIFAPVYLVRLPNKEIVSALSHELAHFMQKRGQIEGYLEHIDVRLEKGFPAMRESQEKAATTAYDLFKEPIRSWLSEWDRTVASGKYKEQLRSGAKLMKHADFLKYILGDKYESFEEVQKEKIRKKLDL